MTTTNPQHPDRERELTDLALDWMQSTFARTVALKIMPLLLPIIGIALAWLQNTLGLDLDPAVVAAAIASGLLGAAGIVLQWVRNHGQGAKDIGVTLLELERLYEAGRQELDQAGPGDSTPTVPPGLHREA